MPDLTDAVLLAATAWPGTQTADSLAEDFGVSAKEIASAITDLRDRGLLQKKRGSPKWGGVDRLRASKAGREACRATLRREIQSG